MGKAAAEARASSRIDRQRLWDRHMALAKIGATPGGGVDRQALTPEDTAARAQFVRWVQQAGFACAVDPIGNIFARLPGTEQDAPPVVTGSHLDTQPQGGRFDGIYGVLAGLEVLHAVAESGITIRRQLEAVVWTNEEGCRFVPGCLGSAVFVDPKRLEPSLAIKGADGVVLGDALAESLKAMPKLGRRRLGGPVAAHVEAHIEQGPILEEAGKTIGVVTAIAGGRRFWVDVQGEAGHSGTTTRRRRKDAFVAAHRMIGELYRVFHDAEDRNRFTIGAFDLQPGSTYIVPARARFTIDFRQTDEEIIERLGSLVEGICRDNASPCTVEVKEFHRTKPRRFFGLVPDTILEATRRLGLSHMHMGSGAGHDAQNFADVCPAGMIFVPCERGISHAEVENAKPEDLAAGAAVLADTMVALANR